MRKKSFAKSVINEHLEEDRKDSDEKERYRARKIERPLIIQCSSRIAVVTGCIHTFIQLDFSSIKTGW